MVFQVRIAKKAKLEIEAAYEWLKQQNPNYADRWFREFMDTLATLQEKPQRCALARENEVVQEEVRQLIYGKRRNIYRILFVIRGDMVYVLHVRHGSQDALTSVDLDEEE